MPAWLGIAFVLRAAIALTGDFVIHPDEIKYLEPAHLLVFGNGVLHLDYIYGIRSWLVPGLVAAVLWLSDTAGLGQPWFYVGAVKLVFCLLSLSIPWGAYHYTRCIASEKSARIALILACLWPYLIGYAHKPMTEFIAADLCLAALGLAGLKGLRQPAHAAAAGLLLALACLVRPHYAPAVLVMWVLLCFPLPPRGVAAMICGSALAAILVGLLEWLTWGGFFSSYLKYLQVNLGLYAQRVPEPPYFYLPHLLLVTAGGIVPAAWLMIKRPRPYLLIGLCMAVVLVVHTLAAHKEFRFVFLLLVLSLIPLACWLGERSRKSARPPLLPACAAGLFSLLVLSNLLPVDPFADTWLPHDDNIRYLRGQSNIFAVYRSLASLDDVTGVAHLADEYQGTPGYYYLHKRVPFYDRSAIKALADKFDLRLGQLASHVVTTNRRLDHDENFTLLSDSGAYKVYRNAGNAKVPSWVDYRVMKVTEQERGRIEGILQEERTITQVEKLIDSDL